MDGENGVLTIWRSIVTYVKIVACFENEINIQKHLKQICVCTALFYSTIVTVPVSHR